MKQFFVGLVTVFVLILVGVVAFRGVTGLFGRLFPTASPSPVASPSAIVQASPSASVKPSTTPEPSVKGGIVTTKGGVAVSGSKGIVKGVTTTKTVTTTTQHLTLTLVKTNECRNYMTEIKDIKGNLTLKRWLKPDYSIKVTVWNKDGNELLNNTTYSGSGDIKSFSNVDYLKVRVEPDKCPTTADTWVIVTAER